MDMSRWKIISMQRRSRQRLSLLAVLQLLLSFSMVPPVEAKCDLRDKNDKKVSLSKLPDGVAYDLENDILQCNKPNSCEGWTISKCLVVQCQAHQSCKKTKFRETRGIACWAELACQNADMALAHTVACGVSEMAVNACNYAIIEFSSTVLCYGPNACGSSDALAPHTMFEIDATSPGGVIDCGGGGEPVNDPSRGFIPACQNMIVQVHSTEKACVYRSPYTDSDTCAVICATERDCNVDSIQFEVK